MPTIASLLLSDFSLHFLAIDARRIARYSLKKDAHIFHMLKPGQLGYFFQGEVGFDQQLTDLGDLDPPNLSLRGTPEVVTKFLFQLAA